MPPFLNSWYISMRCLHCQLICMNKRMVQAAPAQKTMVQAAPAQKRMVQAAPAQKRMVQATPAQLDTTYGVIFNRNQSLKVWQGKVLPTSYFSAVHR